MCMGSVCEQCLDSTLNTQSIYVTCFRAVRDGHLECLKAAYHRGFPWNESICAAAASYGHVHCLRYAHENGCPWDHFTLINAAQCDIGCLRYALAKGCPQPLESLCAHAAAAGKIECLKHLHECGFVWDIYTCMSASAYGNMECLKYAHENGCPWNYKTLLYASKNGHIDILKYAHEHGCPWHEDVCEVAAQYGRLKCLKYAHENGCPWDTKTCEIAAQNYNIDCLLYAYTNGCPWNFINSPYTTHRKLLNIWRLDYVCKTLGRKWKEKRLTKQRDAVRKIEEAVIHFLYKPYGPGYKRVQRDFNARYEV